jgi:hypothetical protein
MRFILECGILAPSGDNTQPWRFRIVSDSEIELRLFKSDNAAHFFEAGNRTLYLSCGAVIENMRVAASKFGNQLHANFFPIAQDPLLVARLQIKRSNQNKSKHLDVLPKRLTNRKFFSKQGIPADLPLELAGLSSGAARVRLIGNTEPGFKQLAALIGKSERIRFENKKVHTEFTPVLRFTRHESEATRDGLDVRTFEAGPLSPLIFRAGKNWGGQKALNVFGFSRQIFFYTYFLALSSDAIGFVAADSFSELDFLKGGEVVERIWHELTVKGYYLQPMESFPVFLINWQLNQLKDFSDAQKELFLTLKNEFYSLTGTEESQGLIFMFRVGRASAPKVRSLRKPLECFIQP